MTDFIGFVLQGLFTGIGTATGLWAYERYIRPRLDRGHQHIEKIASFIKYPESKEDK